MSTTTNAARYQTCLWFDADGLEAAEHYTSLLPDAEITGVSRYPDDVDKGTPGAVMQVDFRLGAQRFVALNGGPQFPTPRRSRSRSTSRPRRTSTGSGRVCSPAAKRRCAGGCETGSGCPGRSSPLVWASCSPTPIPNPWAGLCANCRR